MILLDRYIFRQYAKNLLLVAAALVTVYLLVDFFELIDDFLEHGKGLGLAAKYFILKTPLIVEQLSPVIILLGGIIVLGLLNHRGEILALKAVGIHTFRITFPITGTALVFTLLILAFAEFIVPPTTAATNVIRYEQLENKATGGILRGNRYFHKNYEGFYSFEKNEETENRFDNFTFVSWDKEYSLKTYLTAGSASWSAGVWTLTDCRIKQKTARGGYQVRTYRKTGFPFEADPGDFFIPVYKVNEMSLSGLYSLAKENRGPRGSEAGLKLLERISFIFLGIPLLMLGLPLVLAAHQRWGRDLSLAIPLSCGLALAAWGGWSVMQSFAKAEAISPHLAAWSVHLLIAAIGTFLILQENR
jgi:lipopolysaccharide export system permease protein